MGEWWCCGSLAGPRTSMGSAQSTKWGEELRHQGPAPWEGPDLLMAAVPFPRVPRPVGEEVRSALVLHALGEA